MDRRCGPGASCLGSVACSSSRHHRDLPTGAGRSSTTPVQSWRSRTTSCVWNATASSTPVTVIRMRDYGPRVRTGVHGQQVHDQIAHALKGSRRVRLDFTGVESVGEAFLDRSLGALIAWHGATILRSLVFAHCSPCVAASIGKAFPQAIRPSYIEPVTSVLGEPRKPQGEIVHPAACRQCGKSYADILAVPMTADDLNIVGDRLSESTRQALQGAATELTPGLYEVAMTEQGARDLAAKAANLGLVVIGQKIR